jgi:hypothetical protein
MCILAGCLCRGLAVVFQVANNVVLLETLFPEAIVEFCLPKMEIDVSLREGDAGSR